MASALSLLVNGERREVALADDQTPLLYVLRDDLGLKGTRYGCGTGHCGACMVLIDGRAQRSCEVPVGSVEGASIITIEGLGAPDRMHPLQRAIIDFQAGQCGYCLSGIVMKAAELLEHEAQPSRQKIVESLSGNLCRCGVHDRIIRAIEAAWKSVREGTES
jgi:aerobic-type carbon monoxide dehydrogenase small subunit (CoxS/CutS family)